MCIADFRRHPPRMGSGRAERGGEIAIAIGTGAGAVGPGDVAVGQGAQVLADNGSAYGAGAIVGAGHTNAAAFGAGATTTQANQQTFGTASNTYTMSGITSGASKTVQGAPSHLVTSNAGGDLAAHTFAELGLVTQGDISNFATQGDLNAVNARLNALSGRTDKALSGVAMAFAMAGVPELTPGESFALMGNWGTFEGENGLAMNGAMRLAKNVQLNGGVAWGLSENLAGGRVGVRVGW